MNLDENFSGGGGTDVDNNSQSPASSEPPCEPSDDSAVQVNGAHLTKRELAILKLLMLGLLNKEIASSLQIKCRTVEYHLQNLYNKLGVHTRTEAVIWVMAHGITTETQ
jgi:DNA-binding NarL/FixJ family response regulator